MRRPPLVVAALACFALACILAPVPPRAQGGFLSAVGRSLGGARVVLIDALFLRGRALQSRGRVDEARAVYEVVLELDPGNASGVYFLSGVYAFDILPEAPDAAARLGWWREAWALVERGLGRHPDSALLLLRSSDLLGEVPAHHADLEEAVAREIPDADRLDIERLLRAARITADVGTRGRIHLVRLVYWLPVVALRRLHLDGEQMLDAAQEVQQLRRAELEQIRQPPLDAPPPGYPPDGMPLREILSREIEVVRAVGRALAVGDKEAARAAARAFAEAVPGTPLESALEAATR